MPNPLVSIIICTYNGLPWLKESISSALNQSYDNCEIIIVDDGSKDNTKNLIETNFSKKVRYYYQNNKGLSSARNLGLKLAKGDYIQFLDADDLIPLNKIENHVNFLREHTKIDIVYSHCKTFFNEELNKQYDWDRKPFYANGDIFCKMLEKTFLLPHMALSNKFFLNKVGDFDTTINSCVDYDFWLRVALCGGNFHFLDDGMFVLYRVHNNNISSRLNSQFAINGLAVLKNIELKINKDDQIIRKKIKKTRGSWIFKRGRAYLNEGERYLAYKDMVTSLILNRQNLFYKISVMFTSFFMQPEEIENFLKKLKKWIVK